MITTKIHRSILSNGTTIMLRTDPIQHSVKLPFQRNQLICQLRSSPERSGYIFNDKSALNVLQTYGRQFLTCSEAVT